MLYDSSRGSLAKAEALIPGGAIAPVRALGPVYAAFADFTAGFPVETDPTCADKSSVQASILCRACASARLPAVSGPPVPAVAGNSGGGNGI